MSPTRNSSISPLHDEMTLLDLWQMFRASWRVILVTVVLALILAAGYLSTTPKQYEASLLIKIGQVGVGDTVKQIESTDEVVERLNQPELKKSVVKTMGWKNGDAGERLFKASLRIKVPQGKHVLLTLRGLSAQNARDAAFAAFANLASDHHALISKIVAKSTQDLMATVAEIADTEALLGRLERLGKEIPQGDYQETLMLLRISQDKKDRLRALKRQENAIREALSPELNVATTVAQPINVSAHPVYPNAKHIWLIAAIGGVLSGMLLITMQALLGTKKFFLFPMLGIRGANIMRSPANSIQK